MTVEQIHQTINEITQEVLHGDYKVQEKKKWKIIKSTPLREIIIKTVDVLANPTLLEVYDLVLENKMINTGNQWNEDFKWNKEYLHSLTTFELLKLIVKYIKKEDEYYD